MKIAFDAPAQHVDGAGLGQPRGALDQDMAIGQQGDQHALDQTLLTENLTGHMIAQTLQFGLRRRQGCRGMIGGMGQ